ncbi:hypothetical protein ACNKHM_09455 [Shigella sonnei]
MRRNRRHHDPRTDCDLFPDDLCWYWNISLATLPVIAEVAKEQGVKPCRPL